MSSPVSSSRTELIISFGNFRHANWYGVTVRCDLFTEATMYSWVGETLLRVWLRVLWAGVSTSFSILPYCAASWGERLSETWWAAVGGVTTLGGGANVGGGTTLVGSTVDKVKGVASFAGVRATQTRM